MKGKVREERQGKIERIEKRRRTGAYRRCRKCPGKPAETSGFVEKFRRPGGTICRGNKGGKGRGPRAFYR
jgi:hypothetical protein